MGKPATDLLERIAESLLAAHSMAKQDGDAELQRSIEVSLMHVGYRIGDLLLRDQASATSVSKPARAKPTHAVARA